MDIGCTAHFASHRTCGKMSLSRAILGSDANRLQLCDNIQDCLPHVTWCAGGPLAFLPLHAAGTYGSREASPTMATFDFVASSYTPSIAALLSAQRDTGKTEPKALVIAQPNTPNQSPLPGVTKEVNFIREYLPGSPMILNGSDATVSAVSTALKDYTWVHLACHGIQDKADSIKSAFALHDGKLSISELMKISSKGAELAVLSACQTATGDEKIPEEAMHLAGGMVAAGFKSVIGTMWSIGDKDAPVVAEEFYKIINKQREYGGKMQPAYALHEAVKVLREKIGEENFIGWIPFVHFGV